MFFPVGDTQVKGGYTPYFSYSFIVLNVLIFLWQISHPYLHIEHALVPMEILQGEDTYTLISSMFMHGSWMHLLGNMLFLWVFADNIEATVGNFNFLAFYLLGGLAATGAHILFNTGSAVPSLGASGAIAAVLGAYLVMFPKSRIKTFIFYFIVGIPAFVFLGIWFFMQFSGLMGAESGVAWWAHIGGFVFGLIAGYFGRSSLPGRRPPRRAARSRSGDYV